jgi:hypothetical protein
MLMDGVEHVEHQVGFGFEGPEKLGADGNFHREHYLVARGLVS